MFDPYRTYIGCLPSVSGGAGTAAFAISFERKLNAVVDGIARSWCFPSRGMACT